MLTCGSIAPAVLLVEIRSGCVSAGWVYTSVESTFVFSVQVC